MRRPVRPRAKKKLLKGDCENKLDGEKNELDLISSYTENSNKCTERNVLKDQTNVIGRDQSPVINTPSSSNSLKYDLRRCNLVDYKKLSNGLHCSSNENKANLNIVKSITPKCSNKIFKSVSDDKITADFKSNANSEMTPALKNSKPIYNIHTQTPRPRQSMPIEKKLAIYEFEVDENEPKVKQKRKRIRKVGEKKKSKKEQEKIVAKNVAASLHKCKKTPFVRLVRLESAKKVLSTQNSSYIGNRTPAYNSIEHDSLPSQKEHLSRTTLEVPVLFHNHQNATPTKKNTSVSKPGFSAMSDEEEVGNGHQDQLDNRTSACNSIEHDSLPSQKENLSRTALEVPVLFHNHQNATPTKKNTSMSKPGFSAMSDEEEVGNSHQDQLDNTFFSKAKRSLNMKEETLRTSFSHDCSYDYPINASTPVKYNHNSTTANSSSIENCFGFDEPEVFEEPLISPIKNPAEGVRNQGEIETTPYRFRQKQDEKKEEIPVIQVLKMLKYGIGNESNSEIKSSSSSNSVSPIFNEPAAEHDKLTNITIKEKKMEKSVRPVARRSYERPAYLRKYTSFEEDDPGEESDEDKKKKTFLPKKKHGPTKKEKEEMQKWINAFNSQCQEVEKYNLVVE